MFETVWGKKRILEVYLNVAVMGKGVFGIEAASQKYFKRPAIRLTRQQAALIAACLPSPKKYSVKNPSDYVLRRSNWILIQMDNLAGDEDIERLISNVPPKTNRPKRKP
jgi:monofunctional biosynthetic peptidoglycan transglycosylase